MKIFEASFPGKTGVWIFDNSSAHGSLSKDALTVTKMNVGPGGVQAVMRDTIIPADNPHGLGGNPQRMVFDEDLPDDHPYKEYEGRPKGMRVVLEERKLIKEKQKINGTCKKCTEFKARKPHVDGLSPSETRQADNEDGNDTEEEEDARPTDCCLSRILSLQSDFKNEQSMLEKVCRPISEPCLDAHATRRLLSMQATSAFSSRSSIRNSILSRCIGAG